MKFDAGTADLLGALLESVTDQEVRRRANGGGSGAG